MKKKFAVFTSGGDSPGMNAAIRAVVRSSINNGVEVFGIFRGYEGLIDGEIKQLYSHSVSGILQKGGTILRTARSKRFMEKDGRAQAYAQLQKYGITGLVAIGGDGTFTGASVFSHEYDVSIVGVPGTIDNDIFGSDYTIGYDTALNTVIEAVDKIHDTASSHSRIFFVEVMGREAGFIALESAIATGAEAVLIPERDQQLPIIEEFLTRRASVDKSSIIIVAEGSRDGNATQLAERFKLLYPKFDFRVSILGHIQRGGKPSCIDRVTASRMGVAAVEALLDDQKSLMIGLENNKIVHIPLNRVVKAHKKVAEEYLKIAQILSN